eukprot:TRINITY_DN1713_c0_g1_i1.p1 TRINITY_DN1713_c0_g1~~TRINITY_DN1713_c0_g1_i1.p1  ORF type:complete len:420 (+),score=130.08 TRINITY_DN1713_c0_g1_i1:24-1262(+)
MTGGVKVIILVGGPSKGTRFRPLSLDVVKPLFPIAGKPLIGHHLGACAQLQDLREVFLMGFYNEQDPKWKEFISEQEKTLKVPIKFLREESRLGTAGGLKKFQSEILSGQPDFLVLMHCDVVCTFPLTEMISFHKTHGRTCTILSKQVPEGEAKKYGCVVVDPETNQALHYAEKPETFISNKINAGVYVFTPSLLFPLIDKVSGEKTTEVSMADDEEEEVRDFLRLEQDVLMKICGEKHVYVFQIPDFEFWLPLKSAGMVVLASQYMLAYLRNVEPQKLATPSSGLTIVGDVLIHPSAQIDPSAKIGPNVSIGSGVKIGPGVRIQHSIILDNADIKSSCCILYSIVGWNAVIGKWSRVEGAPDFKADSPDALKTGITILGGGVTVGAESVIRSCIALPHKDLSGIYSNLILL